VYWDISDLMNTNTYGGRVIKSITMSSVSKSIKRITVKGQFTETDIANINYGRFLGFFKDIAGLQYNVKEIWFYKDAMLNLKAIPGGLSFDYDLDYRDFVVPSDQLWHEQTVYKLMKQHFLKTSKTVWKSQFQDRRSNDIEVKFIYEIEFNNGCPKMERAVLVRINELHHPTSLQDVPVQYPIKLQVNPA
jgi:hypothetical protein